MLPRFQVEAGRDLNYKVCYPRAELRSPVHRLGFELFQVLLSPARRHSLQRTGAGRRFRPPDEVSVERRPRLFSLSRFPVPQRHVARGPVHFFSIIRAAAKARCNMTLPLFCTTARPTCRRSCASNCWIIISTRWPVSSISIATAFMQSLLRLRLRPHHAGVGRLWFSRLLRTQSAFSAKRALRAEKPALAAAQRRTAHRVAGADGSLQEHGGLGEIAGPGFRSRKV